MFDTNVGELKSPQQKFAPNPQISGKNGGASLNLHQFARDGVVLLGHVRDAHAGRLEVDPIVWTKFRPPLDGVAG